MGEEKRFVLFLVLTMLVVVLTQPLFRLIGVVPKPAAQAPKEPGDGQDAAAKEEAVKPAAKRPDLAKVGEAPAAAVVVKGPEAPPLPEDEPEKESRTLGSTDPATGYNMKVRFTNHGAAVEQIELGGYQNEDRTGPLQLVSPVDDGEGSFLFGIKGLADQLEERNWKILDVPAGVEQPDVQMTIAFQTTLADEGLVVTKTYTLAKSSFKLGLEIEISNRGDEARAVAYRLGGPRGFVLEGAWYATKKRDAAIGHGKGADLKRDTIPATELLKGVQPILALADASGAIRREKWTLPPSWPDRFDLDGNKQLIGEEVDRAVQYWAAGEKGRRTARPVRIAGVEGQVFCVLLSVPSPTTEEDRWDAATTPALRLTNDELKKLKKRRKLAHPDWCDVSVEIESNSFEIAPGDSLRHSFTVYAGPRKKAVLEESLQDSVMVQSIMNFQGALFIFPDWLVGLTASTMLFLLQIFHGWVGNWGIAILMLTAMVRLLMFPLSRKQAMSAVKMQSLKPDLDALKEKYKNDKEKLSRAQMELWRKHGVNPLGGCLPLLVQMPIFIGLWQGLQSSVDLRQAKFFGWIDNLAAPDALFPFPWPDNIWPLSYLGPYFNLLPAILIALMMIQQKMFMPPKADPPDPQMEMQQKMMTYMLVLFGAFFWRLPSGLCLYYICSTTWGIVERKLLPKLQHVQTPSAAGQEKTSDAAERKGRGSDRDGKGGGPAGPPPPPPPPPPGRQDPSLAEKIQESLKALLNKAGKR
jgi:YidC/Oxa1 family membrane protein insertase